MKLPPNPPMLDRVLNVPAMFFLFCASLAAGSSAVVLFWVLPKPAAWGPSAFYHPA